MKERSVIIFYDGWQRHLVWRRGEDYVVLSCGTISLTRTFGKCAVQSIKLDAMLHGGVSWRFSNTNWWHSRDCIQMAELKSIFFLFFLFEHIKWHRGESICWLQISIVNTVFVFFFLNHVRNEEKLRITC